MCSTTSIWAARELRFERGRLGQAEAPRLDGAHVVRIPISLRGNCKDARLNRTSSGANDQNRGGSCVGYWRRLVCHRAVIDRTVSQNIAHVAGTWAIDRLMAR